MIHEFGKAWANIYEVIMQVFGVIPSLERFTEMLQKETDCKDLLLHYASSRKERLLSEDYDTRDIQISSKIIQTSVSGSLHFVRDTISIWQGQVVAFVTARHVLSSSIP